MYYDNGPLHEERNQVSSSLKLIHLNWVARKQHDHLSVYKHNFSRNFPQFGNIMRNSGMCWRKIHNCNVSNVQF